MSTQRSTQHRAAVITPGTSFRGDGSIGQVTTGVEMDLLMVLNTTLKWFTADCTIVIDGPGLDVFVGQSDRVRAAGWNHSSVTPWTLYHRKDGRTVSVGVRAAFTGNQLGALFPTDADPGVVAMLLDRYHALTGTAWRGTYMTTAMAGIRLSWENDRYQPLWHMPKIGPGYSTGPLVWSRPLTDVEREWGWVHTFDANRAYLGALINVEASWSALQESGPMRFDPRIPGYWLIALEQPTLDMCTDPGRPPLIPPARLLKGGMAWLTTPMAKHVQATGDGCAVLDSVTGRAGKRATGTPLHPAQARLTRKWAEGLRDALTAVEAMPAGGFRDCLEVAIKRTYKDAVGGTQHAGSRVARPDLGHTTVDTWYATLQRRIQRVYDTQGVWPVEVRTDSVSYADCAPYPTWRNGQGIETLAEALGVSPDHEPRRLGRFRVERITTTDMWIAEHERTTR